MERGQQVHAWLRPKEEVIVVHDREPVPLVDRANGVVEGHGLDVEGGEDGLLVCHGGVIMGGNLRGDNVDFIQIHWTHLLIIS